MAKPRSIQVRAAAALLVLPLLLITAALAQEPPRIQVGATSFTVGEPVTLQATGLEPGGEYLLTVEGPAGEQSEDNLTAGEDGALTHTFELTEAGQWTVLIAGQDVSASLALDATEAGAAAGQRDGAEPGEPAGEATEPAAGEPAAGEATEPAGAEGGQEQVSPERAAAGLTITTDGDAVVGMRGEQRVWRFDFPGDSGGTGAVLDSGGEIWVGHGLSVLVLDRETGRAQRRHAMPGRVIRLEPAGDAVSAVSEADGRVRQRIEIGPEGPASTVRFGTNVESFGWLRREADVPDPQARLERDPTNPWLHLNVGLAARDPAIRDERLEQAVAGGETFFDLAGIARALYRSGEIELANRAMDRALNDFAERDYHPALLTSAELHRAYDFPLAPMEQALAEEDLDAAGFWAPWLYLLSNEETPFARAALTRYAELLSAAGRRDAANLWSERAQVGASPSPAASLERFFLGLGRSGWYAVAALLAAIVALHLTLVAKYWAPQTLALSRAMEDGSKRKPWARLLAIRYWSFTEKLVLVLLFASCLTLLGLTRWYDAAGERPPSLASGTLASPVARDLVTSARIEGARAAFIRGYAAHTAGERRTAQEEYLAAGDYPPAINNLAALLDDDVLYRRALELAPGMPEASFNLGRSPDPSVFHDTYLDDRPLLAVPGTGDFRTSVSGSWERAIGSTFENPWQALRGLPFFGLPGLLWQVLLALFLLWALITVVWLLVPRPALARNAPRTATYHLLALLIPGSGLADEAWGILLMVPWALLGVDALAQWLGWPRSLGLPLETELWALAAIYLINLIAFIVEFLSYRRRMRDLRRHQPETVDAYGMQA
jgi:hypothetical protein